MKVLLVDDAEFVRLSLRKILISSQYEFEFLEAEDGIVAVEKYRSEKPDLVIMDITMPNLDGISAVKQIIEFDAEAKIIMCSSMGYQEKVFSAIDAGAKDFIIKPYDSEKVISSIAAVMKL